MKATIFGASGGLAMALADALLKRDWHLELVTRQSKRAGLAKRFRGSPNTNVAVVGDAYSEFSSSSRSNAYFFTQALFDPKPLLRMKHEEIAREIEVGLTDVIQLTQKLLAQHSPSAEERRDFCFVGSTSAYAGFKNTSVYCAVKHGLLGFVRAMNDEYANTNTRFWLFSMGTMDTEMGRRLTEQDSTSFLQPNDVAARIIDAIVSPSNIFEPEVILRRRTIRFVEK